MVQRTPARVQAEQLGYRKSHFFLRLRQKSHAVETRLLRALGVGVVVDVGSGVDAESEAGRGCSDEGEAGGYERGEGLDSVVAGECDQAVEDETLGDSRRNLPSWPRKSLLPELLVIVERGSRGKAAGAAIHLPPLPEQPQRTRASHWDTPPNQPPDEPRGGEERAKGNRTESQRRWSETAGVGVIGDAMIAGLE
jgi:hypothetical protein